jgi:hypothetical protein
MMKAIVDGMVDEVVGECRDLIKTSTAFIEKKRVLHVERMLNAVVAEVEGQCHPDNPVRICCNLVKQLYQQTALNNPTQRARLEWFVTKLSSLLYGAMCICKPGPDAWKPQPLEDDRVDALVTRTWNLKKATTVTYVEGLCEMIREEIQQFKDEHKMKRQKKEEEEEVVE